MMLGLVTAGLVIMFLLWNLGLQPHLERREEKRRAKTPIVIAVGPTGAAGAPAPAAPPPSTTTRAARVARQFGWTIALFVACVGFYIWYAATGGPDTRTWMGLGRWIWDNPVPDLIVLGLISGLIGLHGGAYRKGLFKTLGVATLVAIVLVAVAVNGLPWSEDDGYVVDGPQVRWLTPPTVDHPDNAWGKLNLPGNSKSEFIPLPSGMKAIEVRGDGHRREDVLKRGRIVGFYVYNDDPIFRTFGYAFIPK